MLTFGENVRRARIEKAWSQAELGEKLGVGQGTISNWELGRGEPDRNQKIRLREILGLRQSESKAVSAGSSDKKAGQTQQAETAEQATFGESIRRARIKNAWSQSELGGKLGVGQGTISNWETGRTPPDRNQKIRLREILGLRQSEIKGASAGSSDEQAEKAQQAEAAEQVGPSAFGSWLNRLRNERGLSVTELASKAGVSVPAIYNIEAGRSENPRAQTARRLEKALGKELPAEAKKEIKDEATIGGVGEFFTFDPHDKNDWPEEPGIYVLYDISDRPIYVGQGSSIRKRIQDHEEKFWFKTPIVYTAAYIKIDDGGLRNKIETILIRFLKRNAVINRQNVER
jgi:transcriptional regulator with XRE-family HTH domain